jgi:RND family efflux transporter MFP subunit
MPFPYKVSCDCSMQPVTKRFVAAPFAARLDEVLVEPGDFVSQGQILARMDGREIRWELAALAAELNRAAKLRDSSLAVQDVAAAQLASLEAERLQKKIDLLEDRIKKLELRAPISGLVIAGDLKKTQGAPLPTGQPLFELAPLDRMLAELYIPDEEISRVAEGQRVTIRLDAHPRLAFEGKLARVHPKAEIHQSENVFVGEVLLDNGSQVLRPGMRGETQIVTQKHPLAWNLFHKACERAFRLLGL